MVPVLNVDQIREADQYTIQNEPISSIDLMERASRAFVNRFIQLYPRERLIAVFCGQGNNGGDGLVVARLLYGMGYETQVYVMKLKEEGSPDFEINSKRLQKLSRPVRFLEEGSDLPRFTESTVLIDALLGTGLSKPLKGWPKKLVEHLNQTACERVALDVPSGLFPDTLETRMAFRAHRTLTFQVPKITYFSPEYADWLGEWDVVDIQLHPQILKELNPQAYLLEKADLVPLLQKKGKHHHKGSNGHAAMVGGSKGKIGAMVLATQAMLRSGAGLVSAVVPTCGYTIIQSQAPEALCITSDSEAVLHLTAWSGEGFDALGLGPGLGQSQEALQSLKLILEQSEQPCVLDADALNLLAEHSNLWKDVPKGSILTPHPGEFKRLIGQAGDYLAQVQQAKKIAQDKELYILLKGAYSLLATPGGQLYLTDFGNRGMATGGMGDALTGLLTGLLAQGYSSKDAALMGLYIHGTAGTLALKEQSVESLTAQDLIACMGQAFQSLGEI